MGVKAHRFAYELLVGPIPEGLELDHVKERGCTSKACVNPAHLEPVTTAENVRRSDNPAGRNARKVCCHRGHAFTPENTITTLRRGRPHRACHTCRVVRAAEARDRERRARRAGLGYGGALVRPPTGRQTNARLRAEQVIEIRALAGSPRWSYRLLAERFGVGKSTIEAIVTGRTWRVAGMAELGRLGGVAATDQGSTAPAADGGHEDIFDGGKPAGFAG